MGQHGPEPEGAAGFPGKDLSLHGIWGDSFAGGFSLGRVGWLVGWWCGCFGGTTTTTTNYHQQLYYHYRYVIFFLRPGTEVC